MTINEAGLFARLFGLAVRMILIISFMVCRKWARNAWCIIETIELIMALKILQDAIVGTTTYVIFVGWLIMIGAVLWRIAELALLMFYEPVKDYYYEGP